MKIWSEYLYNLTHNDSAKNPFPDYHIWSTFYGWQRWEGDEHKSGWTEDSIKNLLYANNFCIIDRGTHIFTDLGIVRGRFTRPGDAHLYIKAALK